MDISEYLLLHHNYCARKPTTKSKLKPIRPKPTTNTKKPLTIHVETCDDVDIDPMQVQNDECLSIPTAEFKNMASPSSNSGSDYGYESLDSPNSSTDDIYWDESVTELFPSLL